MLFSEERLSKAIYENKVDDLNDMILDGLNINRKFKSPVGCQYLTLNSEEMVLSGLTFWKKFFFFKTVLKMKDIIFLM